MNTIYRRIGFQFFAEPGDPASEDGKQDQNTGGATEKTFTQEQMNALAASEKRSGRQSVLKELGFEISDDQSYTKALEDAKAAINATKTRAQLDAEALKKAETAKSTAEAEASGLRVQVEALKFGVNPESLDDVITLAMPKVSDTNPISKVLEEMKTKYPVFFNASGSDGTGTSASHARGKSSGGSEGIGKRLASSSKSTAKSSYFKN